MQTVKIHYAVYISKHYRNSNMWSQIAVHKLKTLGHHFTDQNMHVKVMYNAV